MTVWAFADMDPPSRSRTGIAAVAAEARWEAEGGNNPVADLSEPVSKEMSEVCCVCCVNAMELAHMEQMM